jgi:hypothetical protein
VALGDLDDRHPVLHGENLVVRLDHLGDEQRVRAALLPQVVGLDPVHLLGGAQVVALAVELEPLRVVQCGPRLDAQERRVRALLVRGHEVGVVRDQRRDAHLAAHLVQLVLDAHVDLVVVVHDLEEEVLGPEDVPVVGGGLVGLLELPQAHPGLDLARGAAGGRDDSRRVLGDELPVHARLVVVALERGHAGEPEQVPQAFGVLRDHRHVRVRAAAGEVVAALARLAPEHGLLVETVLRGDVGLDAEDRLDAGLLRLLVEPVAAVHVAVVGHRERGLPEALGLREQGFEFRGPVEHRVLGVHMQVDVLVRHASLPL